MNSCVDIAVYGYSRTKTTTPFYWHMHTGKGYGLGPQLLPCIWKALVLEPERPITIRELLCTCGSYIIPYVYYEGNREKNSYPKVNM